MKGRSSAIEITQAKKGGGISAMDRNGDIKICEGPNGGRMAIVQVASECIWPDQ